MSLKFYAKKSIELRKSSKLKVSDITEKLGISSVTLWNWEKEKTVPSAANVKALAKAIGVCPSKISNLPPKKNKSKIDFYDAYSSISKHYSKTSRTKNFDYLLSHLLELKEQVSSYDLVLDAIKGSKDLVFYIKDIEHNYIMANSGFLKIQALASNYDVLGKTDINFFSDKEAKENFLVDDDIISNKTKHISEGYIPGTRKKKWGIITKSPLFDHKGKVLGVFCSFLDITERKKSELSNELLCKSLNASRKRIAVWSSSLDKLIFSNDAFKKFYKKLKSTNCVKDYIVQNIHKDYQQSELDYLNHKSWPDFYKSKLVTKDNDEVEYLVEHQEIIDNGKVFHLFYETDLSDITL